MRWLVFLAAALPIVAVGCKDTPTTVLLRIEAGPGLAAPAELRLSVYSEAGRDVSDERLPPCKGSCPEPELPGEVVLYPPGSSGSIRVLVRAEAKEGTVLGEGTAKVELRAGQQVRATLVIRSGGLPDRDGDGVPDGIDNCPDLPNPTQGPCDGADGGPEDQGPGADGGRDIGPADGPLPDGEIPCSCALGCRPGTSTCYELVPSGGFSAASYKNVPSINSSVTLDTDDCELTVGWTTVQGSVQSGACVVALTSLSIPPSGTLRGEGSRPLVLIVERSVSVSGLIDVGARGATPGPGGSKGGVGATGGPGAAGDGAGGGQVCSCSMAEGDDCGGGGGGFGSAGGDGGEEGTPCTVTSSGGASCGGPSLDPLVGGSGGASSGQSTAGAVSGGGAGGGALQISCAGTIQINGAISAGGGGGQAETPVVGAGSSVGGGGGGSGGAILLEAAEIDGKGLVAANGGGGASGGRDTCGAGAAGEDGAATLNPAKGGASGGTDCGDGGDGAAGTAGAKGGGSTVNSTGGGGGGGGGVGRIRLNWLNHSTTSPLPTSGQTSLGEVQRQ